MLRRLFRSRASAPAAVPDGHRVYAVGDVHGRLDLLEQLLALIAEDDAARGPIMHSHLIFLGDLVDRGPDSAGVVERLRQLSRARPDARFLAGNHEEMFMSALDGDDRALRILCRVGGRETILSYGIGADDYDGMDYDEVGAALAKAVPDAHRSFIAGFEDWIEIGDYAFVHAGIRPGVPMAEQKPKDLRWIREPFLSHKGMHERVIVHGHTVVDEVDRRANRIGIDTGAYASERLTAIVLEGDEVGFLQT